MKKLISLLLTTVVLLGVVCPLLCTAAPQAQAVSPLSTTLCVAKNEAAGLYGDVAVQRMTGQRYMLCLPGSADPSKLYLSWPDSITVTDRLGTALISGQVPVKQFDIGTIALRINGKDANIRVMQGSVGVRAMFLDTDPSIPGFDSFSNMNSDKTKNTEAAGTMRFGSGPDYYFSMKGRGNSNWRSAKKKPYNITIYKDNTYDKKQSISLIDGVEAKKWTLTANYYDDSLLRNRVGYGLAEALGIGLKTDFVDLYVDGQYLGNYLLTPKNDYKAPDNGFVVEIDNWIDNEDPQFILDGMIEYHPTKDGYQHRITLKDNGAKLPNEEIEDYMQSAWDALLDEDSEEYLKYIDLDSWAKYYLLHEFYKSFDVVCGSIIMHRDGTTENDKLIAGPVWDLDNTMGRVQNNADLSMSVEAQHSPEGWYISSVKGKVATHFWLQQLGKQEGFMKRVYEIYNEHKAVFDGAADKLAADITLLTASAEMNERLPNATSGRPAIQSADDCGCTATYNWEDFAQNLHTYVTKRAAFLSDNIPQQPTAPTPSVPATSGSGITFTPVFDSNPLVPWLICGGIVFVVAVIITLIKHRKK